MPTLYEEALVELRARLTALPGLGPAAEKLLCRQWCAQGNGAAVV